MANWPWSLGADHHGPPRSNLVRIRDTMQKLGRKSIIKRIVSSSEHADLLSEHRRQLQDDISKFQVC